MHPVRKKRLTIILFLLAGLSVAVGLTTYALRQNINVFYDPSEIAAGDAPVDARIRAGGMVEAGSVVRSSEDLTVRFRVTDYAEAVTVQYTGILPDLFAEGQGVVAIGRLQADGTFVAEQVLAKHDENYMPPEVSDSLKKAGHPGSDAGASAEKTGY
ncbi:MULTISPECIES: cytochrome c maturation protein CcmE [Marinobacter]|uniref:Cytochrome c-type biogenesis protein CcmE n=1 Tax=Marinobacter xestospongiae TaxID=994319 RepID=A0ABU3VTJ7_9GAMM|nr:MULTISPECIES: cytochrome c maturation protein CcmE [Marinobacter]MDV2077587.1 cytochrome c maturation protein CcmE [Marinobacter xestospongiae]UDL06710.1 cytochrome c maturation protein CcmE [Marinobacter sp. CA1]